MEKYPTINKLSKRAQGVIEIIGGIEELVNHFKKFKSLKHLNYCGAKTKLELEEYVTEVIDYDKNKNNEFNWFSENVVITAFNLYEGFKAEFPEKLLLFLKELEDKFKTEFGDLYKKKFLYENIYIYRPDVLKRSRGIKLKELKKFDEVREIISKYLHEVERCQNVLLSEKQKQFIGEYALIVKNNNIGIESDKYLFSEILNNQHFYFSKLLLISVFNDINGPKTKGIIKEYFLTGINHPNINHIANNINCTGALVRYQVKMFKDSTIKKHVQKIKSINSIVSDMPEIGDAFLFEFGVLDPFMDFIPTTHFTDLVLDNYYLDYISINSVLKSIGDLSAFIVSDSSIIINRTKYESYKIPDLMKGISEFIIASSFLSNDYDIEQYVRQFYYSRGIQILQTDFDNLVQLILKIKREQNQLSTSNRKKFEKRKRINNIIEKVDDFLNTKNKFHSTKDILLYLNENQIKYERSKLLAILKKQPQFVKLGYGYWGKSDWEKSNLLNFDTTISETVASLLKDRITPIHVSEIIKLYSKHREITVKSIMSNLKMSHKNAFVIFNCHFIGLKLFDYENYWYKIPPFSRSKVSKIYDNPELTIKEKVRLISSQYGYPEIHINFLLENQNNRKG